MDPQSAAFVPRDDIWKIQTDMARLQQIQTNHTDRLSRLEQRQDEDSRTKSIWGSSSPFPSILGGTPQQVPVQQPPTDAFSGFDDQPTHLIGSLHLDADDEPRRVGVTSRANSVRFDETANQGHWSHPNRSSLDLLPRSGSSLGSHPMIERTYSHKSDGRQSSAGHSVHSAASRANSMGIDTLNGLGSSGIDAPPLTPGLLILGTVPAIIRCWLTTKFKHDSLLYAAICTGSYTSLISRDLVEALDFSDRVRQDDDISKVKLSVYLPEASIRSTSSRSSSPAHQLPNIAVDFTVVSDWDDDDKSIRIIIGSDVLHAHNADILFSSNIMTLFDDERCKLSTPLVRPEDSRTFKALRTIGAAATAHPSTSESCEKDIAATSNNAVQRSEKSSPQVLPSQKGEEPRLSTDSSASRPSLGLFMAQQSSTSSTPDPSVPSSSTPRSTTQPSSPAVWGNWRREADSKSEWGKPSSTSTYQRREQGIKVLRPSGAQKSTSAATSTTTSSSTSTAPRSFSTSTTAPTTTNAQLSSRFFDDGKRKANGEEARKAGLTKDGKTAVNNPVGQGSAFSWMNT
jgi:ubiquitin carboxyl-terminal hydrolase 4/11